MKRIPHVEARLKRWQFWLLSGGSSAGPRLPIYLKERVDCSFLDGATVPSDDEALETDHAVCRLPDRLQHSVRHVYTSRVGNTIAGYANQLHLAEATLRAHLCHADARLDELLRARRERREPLMAPYGAIVPREK